MRSASGLFQRAMGRIVLLATAGVMFQTTGCSVDTSTVAADFVGAFMNTLISGFVNDQMGVQSSLFF